MYLILKDFTLQHPESVIYFKGSTDERTRLYHRILKAYYLQFSKDFMLFGITGEERSYQAVVYKPENNIEYAAFLVKRIA